MVKESPPINWEKFVEIRIKSQELSLALLAHLAGISSENF